MSNVVPMAEEKTAAQIQAEEWAAKSLDEVAQEAFIYGATGGASLAQAEMTRRLIVALGESKEAADRAARRLWWATVVIAFLTVALFALGILAYLDDSDSASSAEVAALSRQVTDARGNVRHLRQTVALRERPELRTEAAVVSFCQAYRSAKNFPEDEYAVVVVHVLGRACDWAKVPPNVRRPD